MDFDSIISILPEISVAIVLAIIVTLIVVFFVLKKTSRRNVLLTGLRGAGKTLLHSQLVHGQFVSTHTSMKENIGQYVVNGKVLDIIDIPGHERIRDRFFDNFKEGARAIIFVIDSTSIQKDICDVAEYLYELLSDSFVLQKGIPFLIVCNKQDFPLSKNNKAVKSLLETELTNLLITKSSQLEPVDPKSLRVQILLQNFKTFEFPHLPSTKVDFADVNATSENGSTNIEDVKKWIAKLS